MIRAVQNLHMEDVVLNSFTTVADANKCKMYMKNFGEFYNDQIEHANSIILSRTAGIAQKKLDECVELLRAHNAAATIIAAPWDALSGAQILEAMEHKDTLDDELKRLEAEAHEHHHHHEHGGECTCGHDHHHEHGGECTCGHDHHGHHHHHADEVFTSWGVETARRFTKEEIENALAALADSEKYGVILRAKGIVAGQDGRWLHFDFVPEEASVREGSAIVIGRLCVIGAQINEEALKALFA